MSDQGEKTCPLCAEEMDLTDQQLKPCKCGYEICVWCWHHIMEMAEKDETEGRCPACRTPYDKERIVGTAANCERLVADISMEKKQKSQKTKIKSSESRKQLSSVRVIQRNLVYIVGLPLNLADEDLLQRKEYFSQYGKVLKVSISRTSAGTIQQFANNTCSVYITYSKEEEAVRCIQSVHGFILDGRPLRACFGTTKYCHAWLRNVPCNNPDCLYLHEIGSQEDSFAKDEIISAYTRNRVQQITGCTNNMQRRSGTLLPPPTDDYYNNNSPAVGKPVVKNSSNVPATSVKCLPPSSSSGRSGVLPPAASWGSRASNVNPPAGSLADSNGPIKQNAEVNGLLANSTTVSDSTQASMLLKDGGKKCLSNEEAHAMQTKNKFVVEADQHGVNSDSKGSEVPASPSSTPAVKLGNHLPFTPAAESNNGENNLLLDTALSVDDKPCSSGLDEGMLPFADENIQSLCSEMSTMSFDKRTKEHSDIIRSNGLCLDNFLSSAGQSIQLHDSGKLHDDSTSVTSTTAAGAVDFEACDWKSDVQDHDIQKLTSQTEHDFDNQRRRDVILSNQATMSTLPHLLNHLRSPLQHHADAADLVNYTMNTTTATRKPDEGFGAHVPCASVASNGFLNNFVSCASVQGHSYPQLNVGQGNHIGRFDGGVHNVDTQSSVDLGESSIISNILDLDSWDESLTSPQNLAKFLGETDKKEVPIRLANSWKGQISNQSRFSFARQEESRSHLFDFESSVNNIVRGDQNHSFGQSFLENRGPYLDILGNGLGFSHRTERSDNLTNSHSALPSIARSQISAPPGFSVPSRPPPPGFSSHERSDQAFDMKSGNHLLETGSLLRNPFQASPSGNINTASDIELMDPAILAVGKGRLPSGVNNSSMDMRPNFHMQTPLFENDSRLQLLMQRSLSPHQNLRCTEVRDNYAAVNDAYGFTSRHMEQSQPGNLSPFTQFSLQQARNTVAANGHWDGWSEIQTGNDIGVAELLRNDRLGFNKFGMTSSGDLYNRSFRM